MQDRYGYMKNIKSVVFRENSETKVADVPVEWARAELRKLESDVRHGGRGQEKLLPPVSAACLLAGRRQLGQAAARAGACGSLAAEALLLLRLPTLAGGSSMTTATLSHTQRPIIQIT